MSADPSQLTWRAVVDVARREPPDARTATRWLYRYHREPVSWRLRRSFPDAIHVREHLLHGIAGSPEFEPETRWHISPAPRTTTSWIYLHQSVDRWRASGRQKIYISPVTSAMRETVRRILPLLTAEGVQAWKVAGSLDALVRPDKIIVYLQTASERQRLMALLHSQLSGVPAQGVPFAPGAISSGLLSWGLDPPNDHPSRRGSWRSWVTTLAGRALVSNRESPEAAVRCALIDADIDPETLVPGDAVWLRAEHGWN